MKFRGKMKGPDCRIKEVVMKSEKAVKVRCSG